MKSEEIEYTTVTNPGWGNHGARTTMEQTDTSLMQRKPAMDLKQGAGTLGIAAIAAGGAIGLYAAFMALITRGTVKPLTSGLVMFTLAGVGSFVVSAADYKRIGAAIGGGGFALSGGLLVEQFRLWMAQRRTVNQSQAPINSSQAPVNSSPAASSTVNPGGRIGTGGRAVHGPSGRVGQGAFAGSRMS